jgi:lysozyme
MITLIDVSAYQGSPEWSAVAGAGISGVLCKLSEGTGYVSPTFQQDWDGARAAGLTVGAYHFARPDLATSARDEAAYFLTHLPALAPGDLLALDLELGDGDLSGWALSWLQGVQQATGTRPCLYSYPNFIAVHLPNRGLSAYPLWLAEPSAQSWPVALAPFPTVTIWQQAPQAVPGISGEVDVDQFAGTVDQLRALGKPPESSVVGRQSSVTAAFQWVTMTTRQFLRARPQADSARLVDLPVGSVWPISGPPTPHWICVTAGTARGWVLAANARQSVEHPTG